MNRRVPVGSDGDLTALALGRAYREGGVTPLDGIRACLSRLDEHGDALGAVTDRFDGEAIAAAERLTRELRAGRDRGPLHGIAVVVKELIDVAGCPRSAGSHVRPPGWEAPVAEDAPVVATLRAAGAVVVARGRTHEFAWGITSRHPDGTGVVNPYDDRLIAGGSSGGVAALVAAGVAPIGVGTDTGGSVRIPAAFCGLVGWKPAFGALPIEGVVPLAPSLDHVGLLTRSIGDAALADAVLGGGLVPPTADHGSGDAAHGDGRSGVLRVARLRDPSLVEPDPDIVECIDAACARASIEMDVMAGRGADDVPTGEEMEAVYAVVQRAEAIAVHRALGTWPAQAERYGADVAGRLREAEALTPTAVQDAREARQQLRRRYQRVMEGIGVDAVVLPVSAGPPPTVDRPDRAVVRGMDLATREAVMPFTIPADLLGWPTLSIPLPGHPPSGEGDRPPPSLQVMARPGTEDRIARLAHRLGPTS